MKFQDKLDKAVQKNNSLLCVGLDIDLSKIPQTILAKEDPIFIFNREIINATKELVCAYKPNMAFYEMHGIYGLSSLIKTIEYIQSTDIPVILDAKRGDIGNSSAAYAKAIFQIFKADAVTVNPYMGYDSIEPFLEYKEKGVFVWRHTEIYDYFREVLYIDLKRNDWIPVVPRETIKKLNYTKLV